MVEHLLNLHETLSSTSSTAKNKTGKIVGKYRIGLQGGSELIRKKMDEGNMQTSGDRKGLR